MITDGKPSFQFQTNELVEQLDDKGVQRFFVVVSDSDKSVDLMKQYASYPWETNLLHVPGLAPLDADNSVWSQKALTLFCPLAMSSSLITAKEESGGFMHVRYSGYDLSPHVAPPCTAQYIWKELNVQPLTSDLG